MSDDQANLPVAIAHLRDQTKESLDGVRQEVAHAASSGGMPDPWALFRWVYLTTVHGLWVGAVEYVASKKDPASEFLSYAEGVSMNSVERGAMAMSGAIFDIEADALRDWHIAAAKLLKTHWSR